MLTDLAWLPLERMLFGAAILPLYIDEPSVAEDLRPTEDVDALLCLASLGSQQAAQLAVAAVEKELRTHGWSPDVRPHRRNLYAYLSPSKIAVDFVFDALERPGDWVIAASHEPLERTLKSGERLHIPTSALFLVCKVAASRNPKRWEGPYDSHDLEDIAALLAGCHALESSVQSTTPDAAAYLAEWATELTEQNTPYGRQAYAVLEGNWPRRVDIGRLDLLLGIMRSTR